SRFAAQLPPVVSAPTFAIRKRASSVFTLAQYVEQGIMTPEQKEALCAAIGERQNILVIGGTGSGKTTLTNGLIHEMTCLCPHERIIIIEDSAREGLTRLSSLISMARDYPKPIEPLIGDAVDLIVHIA